VQADYWKGEQARAQELLGRAQLRSPIDGVIATPHVDTFAGRRLQFGDTFAEVVDTSSAIIDVAIDASDVSQLRLGEKAAIKLNSYPMRTFHGQVAVVSPKAEAQGESRVFYARVAVSNPDGAMRTGMEAAARSRRDGALRDTCCFVGRSSGSIPESGIGLAGEDERHEVSKQIVFSCFGSRRGFGMQ